VQCEVNKHNNEEKTAKRICRIHVGRIKSGVHLSILVKCSQMYALIQVYVHALHPHICFPAPSAQCVSTSVNNRHFQDGNRLRIDGLRKLCSNPNYNSKLSSEKTYQMNNQPCAPTTTKCVTVLSQVNSSKRNCLSHKYGPKMTCSYAEDKIP
jgi:hypothetical protein